MRRLVYTSSPSVVFDGRDMEGVDESAPYPQHYEAAYPKTKADAERRVLALIVRRESLPDCLEVMAPNVSKGRALQFVLGRLGADASKCVAFGDNMNDIDLLETAGHPFMMNNANPDLIERLPQVPRIGNNFEAGVAHHLRKLFSLEDEIAS